MYYVYVYIVYIYIYVYIYSIYIYTTHTHIYILHTHIYIYYTYIYILHTCIYIYMYAHRHIYTMWHVHLYISHHSVPSHPPKARCSTVPPTVLPAVCRAVACWWWAAPSAAPTWRPSWARSRSDGSRWRRGRRRCGSCRGNGEGGSGIRNLGRYHRYTVFFRDRMYVIWLGKLGWEWSYVDLCTFSEVWCFVTKDLQRQGRKAKKVWGYSV